MSKIKNTGIGHLGSPRFSALEYLGYSIRQFNIEVQFVKSVNYTFEQSL